jgi:ABC-type uncharacterized transport system substrate-binding protein
VSPWTGEPSASFSKCPEARAALTRLASSDVNGLYVSDSTPLFVRRERIYAFARDHRLPAFGRLREFAEAGCLLSHAPSLTANFRRAASYVDRILKGARPTFPSSNPPSSSW